MGRNSRNIGGKGKSWEKRQAIYLVRTERKSVFLFPFARLRPPVLLIRRQCGSEDVTIVKNSGLRRGHGGVSIFLN
jgi:hypothetical protein